MGQLKPPAKTMTSSLAGDCAGVVVMNNTNAKATSRRSRVFIADSSRGKAGERSTRNESSLDHLVRGERHSEERTRNAANKGSPVHHRITSSPNGSPIIVRLRPGF